MNHHFRYKDIYHFPPKTLPSLKAEFIGIWDVQVDDSYLRKQSVFTDDGIFLTWKGAGQMTILESDRKLDLDLNQSNFVLIKKGQSLNYSCLSGKKWHYFLPHFKDLGAVEFLGLKYNTLYQYEDFVRLKEICKRIIVEINRAGSSSNEKLDGMMHEILVCLARAGSGGKIKWTEQISKAKAYISENIDHPLDIHQLVSLTGMSWVNLFKYFRKYTGMTPIQFSLFQKLEMAKQMLMTTDKKIYEIAESLSFYDEYHFSRLFKRKYGLAPDKYRKKRSSLYR